MWPTLLLTLPWVGVIAFLVLVARPPRELPRAEDLGRAPLVSVIVPARNEEQNIGTCVGSLLASTYPSFEVIVVDDGSEDRTADIVRGMERGNAREVRLLQGGELPAGWLGKPWACRRGAEVARGDLLLFTDADTRHAPDLLSRAVAALDEDRADLLTVIGSQLMETVWERLVQPQIFMLMLFRFPDLDRTARSASAWDAIANGQYLLFTREGYEAVGGHAAVRLEVAEDLALAQRVKREGRSLSIRGSQDGLATRMYRSLAEIREGWSKNLYVGGLQTLPPWLRPLAAPLSLATGIVLWIAPPVTLVLALAGVGSTATFVWSASACGLSVLIWTAFLREMEVPLGYAPLYPVGAAVSAYIFARSWTRGRRVEWKGRRYTLPPSEPGGA
ncbi:MAG: glycosyltransferase family 2 protein [Gemmatimonadales bacterium]